MAYMPGQSDRRRPHEKNNEFLKDTEIIKQEEPISSHADQNDERQKPPIPIPDEKNQSLLSERQPSRQEKTESHQQPPIGKKKHTPRFLVLFLLTGTVIAMLFGTVSFIQVRNLAQELARTQNVLTNRIVEETSVLKNTIQDHNRFLGPNGIFDQYLHAHNLLERKLVDIEDIFLAADTKDFSKVGFFRILITGSRPVWVQIDDQGRRPLSTQLFPGLSREMLYYYKEPQVQLDGTTISLSRRFDITSGNYENTYLVFFSFGSVKVVQMTAQKVTDVLSRYSIWIPAQ